MAEILGTVLFGFFSVSLIVSVTTFLVAVVEVRVHLPRRVVFELRVPIVAEMNRRTTVREHGLIFFVFARRRTNDVHDCRASNHVLQGLRTVFGRLLLFKEKKYHINKNLYACGRTHRVRDSMDCDAHMSARRTKTQPRDFEEKQNVANHRVSDRAVSVGERAS